MIHNLTGAFPTLVDRAVSLQAAASTAVFVAAVALITSAATGMWTNTSRTDKPDEYEEAA